MLDLDDCMLSGSAITAPFLRDGLPLVLNLRADIQWDAIRRSLRGAGAERVTARLGSALGYGRPSRQDPVPTRDGEEDGGWLLQASNGTRLRAWSIADGTDLDSARRVSPTRIAQRVLFARAESAGLLTNGDVLRLLICDPTRADGHLSIGVGSWRQSREPPDSFRVIRALAGAEGLPRLPAVLEAARLHQVRVTTELSRQAKQAVVGFITAIPDRSGLEAPALWQEGLTLVYRLLFILKLESPAEPGGGFSFASSRLWRESLSPNRALGPLVRRHLDHAHDTGRMLETGLRTVFNVFRDGLSCSELTIAPLGGALFGEGTTPSLDRLHWGDRAVAILLDRLIWMTAASGERVRVHYGSLDVEDLGGIYEGLLEQQPGIATEPMARVRRGKMEAVVPAADGDIMPGAFYLRAGMGRKSSGSFYTPHEFVRFLVHEALDPKIAQLSPPDDPHPLRLLTLKIVDPATGSGHFLVEACRYLGEALLTACRRCDELGLQDRIAALPDPDNTVSAYLPSRGFAETRARAICRRLVAVHCLYGCDRNQLAVELAKLSLWLESYAEGLPLTFLDHRLIHGDALTGPFFAALSTLPVTGGPLDPLLARGVSDRLNAALAKARLLVAQLNATIGRDVADVATKQQVKDRLDRLLYPLRQLAGAWAEAAMLRQRDGDDRWLALATWVADHGVWPADAVQTDAVPWDLTFPEIFPNGFSVVLGNPPWDVVLPNTRDFVADYDPTIMDATTRGQQAAIQQAVLARPGMAAAFDAYRAGFERTKRIAAKLYRHQRAAATGGSLDLFRLFAERNMDLAAADGSIGVLMPSAFHANEGTTGIRHLYLRETRFAWLLSFENRRRIFDIDSRFKFDAIVAHRPGPTEILRCGFYLDRIADAADPAKIMTYDMAFLRSAGTGLAPLELRGAIDLRIARTLFDQPGRLAGWCADRGIRFGCDLHMTADAGLFQPTGAGDLLVYEGKTFHQYTGKWDASPRYSVASAVLKPAIADAARYRRLAFRDIARSNDDRTMIAFLAPPGVVFGHTATVEKTPANRSIEDASVLCAIFNTFTFDWLVRQKVATHLSLYMLEGLPLPDLRVAAYRFLSQAALCLSEEQSGDNTMLRAQIDAVVAKSYRLDRPSYEHLLRSFGHRTSPEDSMLCLRAFDDYEPDLV